MDDLLKNWDRDLGPDKLAQLAVNIQRRSFLIHTAKSAMALGFIPAAGFLGACSDSGTGTQQALIKQEPWTTFALVQEQLFPTDGNGPGVMQINAAFYLKFVLEAPDTDPADKKFILDGIGWLNDLALQEFKKVFAHCSQQKQAKLLQKINESRAGENWLSYLLLYLFEALLTDPVYGANPDGIGWKWLEHQPGFPAPPADKRYLDLL